MNFKTYSCCGLNLRRMQVRCAAGSALALFLAFLSMSFLARADVQSDTQEQVREVLRNEFAHAAEPAFVTYLSSETSKRTGGHLWDERVVEFSGGTLRRLLAIDGKRLSPEKAQREEERIKDLVSHPEKLRRQSSSRRSDHMSPQEWANAMSHAFLFTFAGEDGGCSRILFKPNRAFHPSGAEQKILSALEGELAIQRTARRICSVKAKTVSETKIGLGLLADIQSGGRIALSRIQLTNNSWVLQSAYVNLHVRAILVRNISEEYIERHTEIREIPRDTNAQQALAVIQQSSEQKGSHQD